VPRYITAMNCISPVEKENQEAANVVRERPTLCIFGKVQGRRCRDKISLKRTGKSPLERECVVADALDRAQALWRQHLLCFAPGCLHSVHANAFEPSLFEPKSPLPGNGIFKAETNGSKRSRSLEDCDPETKPAHRTQLISGYSCAGQCARASHHRCHHLRNGYGPNRSQR
jgi:hypothetical protein